MKNLIIALSLVIATIAFADTTFVPAGEVTGTWTATNSPYIIQGNINVPENDTLIIEAGVKCLFAGSYSLSTGSFSVFKIRGTTTDSVYFEPLTPTGSWRGISVGEIAPSCTLSYTIIRQAKVIGDDIKGAGLRVNQLPTRRFIIKGCKFESDSAIASGWYPDAHGGAISVLGGRVSIEDCIFNNNFGSDIGGTIQITNDLEGQIEVKGCDFQNNGGNDVIGCGGDLHQIRIQDCSFFQNNADEAVIYIRICDTCEVEHCDFTNNSANYAIIYAYYYASISNCEFSFNETTEGGGVIYIPSNSELIIDSCGFSDNISAGNGSIVSTGWSNHRVAIENSFFNNNESISNGGVIYMADDSDELDVENCSFTNNLANNGGVIQTVSSDVIVRNSIFQGNIASSYGGAIYGGGNYTRCVFEGNNSQSGGVFYGTALGASFNACEFYGNTSTWYGGVFSNANHNLTVTNSIIDSCSSYEGAVLNLNGGNATFNSCLINRAYAGYQGGISRIDIGTSSTITFFNSIILDAQAPDGDFIADDGGSDVIKIYGSYYDTSLSWIGSGYSLDSSSNITVLPTFDDTSSFQFYPIYSSSAVNSGLDSCSSLIPPPNDIIGNPRPFAAGYDIGPYEWQITGVSEHDLPQNIDLSVYPNPFNSAVSITAPEGAKIEIFDVNGRIVDNLSVGSRPPSTASHKMTGDAGVAPTIREYIWTPNDNIGSGIFLVRAKYADESISKRIVYLK